jgi:hypothetical protein
MRRLLAAVAVASAGSALLASHAAVNARLLRTPRPGDAGRGRVSALVPARDEAGRIGDCVGALLASTGLDELEVLVLDDASSDATAEVAAAAGAGDDRLRVLAGRPLAAGWLGKPHACRQLAEAATGDVLVFVDADVVVEPWGLAATVSLLREAALDVVSPYPRQEAEGPGPRLVQPLLQWSWLTFLPLRLAEDTPWPSLTAANGQLLAVAREAYRRLGGHAAVRSAVLEDVALARAAKRAGLRVALADGTGLATCRMYDGWEDLRDGYSKSLWAAFGSPAGAAGTLAGLAFLYVLPPAAALAGLARRRPALGLAGALGYAAGVAGRVIAALRTGGRPADALAHPLSIVALGWLTWRSWYRRWRGELTWKGREISA